MTDLIDGYTSEAHYCQHIQPILDALPADRRGRLYAPRNIAQDIVRTYKIACAVGHAPSPSTGPLIVAGYQDAVFGRRPKVLINHGAGQTYQQVESGSFAGGPGHEAVDLFLVASQRMADLELARYPRARAAVVGCPKLDAWRDVPYPTDERGRAAETIAVTFHWHQCVRAADGTIVSEAGWAWPDWRDTIAELAKVRPVVGHCHPRARRDLEAWWASIGVEYVPDATELLARAGTLVLDNSSLGAEWAAVGRPTVWLRGSDWSEVRHGDPRFGGPLPGPELTPPSTVGQLVAAVDEAGRAWEARRAEFAHRIYGVTDGHAAERAVAAVLALADAHA